MPPAATGTNLLLKAIEILDAVTQADAPPRLTDIARRTGLPTGTAHRILDTLVRQRFLRRDDASRTFRLGARFLQMSRGAWEDYDLRAAAVPELERLQAELGQVITLAVLADGGLIVLDRRRSRDALRSAFDIGSSLPLHCTAPGKAVLSAWRPGEWEALELSAATPNTITDRTTLRAHLELAAANHFTVDDEESALGLRGCAAAILDEAGRPLGTISFSGPAELVSVARCRAIGPVLAEAAERVSWNLGFNPPDRWPDLAIGRRTTAVSAVGTATAFVAANPLWSERRGGVFWSDRTRPALRFNGLDGGEECIPLPSRAQALAESADGLRLMLADGLYGFRFADGALTRLADPLGATPSLACTNGACDARGRLWLTTMDRTLSRATGGLHRLDDDGSLHRVADGMLMPLGLAWSPDNRLIYFSDGPKRQIHCAAFDLDSGTLGASRVFARLPEGSGRPTGLAVDAEGHVWNTQSEGWRVVRYAPGGETSQVLELPVPRPLDLGFGGADGRTLFITSTRLGIPERRLAELSLSGALLAFRTAVPGLPRHPMR